MIKSANNTPTAFFVSFPYEDPYLSIAGDLNRSLYQGLIYA